MPNIQWELEQPERCKIHPHVKMIVRAKGTSFAGSWCPACRGAQGGKSRSAAKAKSSRANGKLSPGGPTGPRKNKRKLSQ